MASAYEDQPMSDFENWAVKEGLSIEPAFSLVCENGVSPATYWNWPTECAWRAWANKPEPKQTLVDSKIEIGDGKVGTFINWVELSKRGLVTRINSEITHRLGLAVCYNPKTGSSPGALVSEDGVWVYTDGAGITSVPDDEDCQFCDGVGSIAIPDVGVSDCNACYGTGKQLTETERQYYQMAMDESKWSNWDIAKVVGVGAIFLIWGLDRYFHFLPLF